MDDKLPNPDEVTVKRCDSAEINIVAAPEAAKDFLSSEEQLLPRSIQFVQYWIKRHRDLGNVDILVDDRINWDRVPKCLHEICVLERQKGQMVARNECVTRGTGNESSIEVILVDQDICKYFSGTFIEILDGSVNLRNAMPSNTDSTQHFTTKSPLEFTLLVDFMELGNEEIKTDRLVWLISEHHVAQVQDIITGRSMFAKAIKNPEWDDWEGYQVQSGTSERTDWLQYFSDQQLNEMLQTGLLQTSLRKKLKLSKGPHISRWLKTSVFQKHKTQQNTIYIVFNAKDKDLSTVTELINGQAFYIEDIEELSYLPNQQQVPVTYNLDCSAAVKHLETLSAVINPDTSDTAPNIQLLKFYGDKLYRVIPEKDLLEEDSRFLVIRGALLEGKSTVLRSAYETCLDFACIVSSSDLILQFPVRHINVLTADQVHSFLYEQQGWTQADLEVLKEALHNAKWTLFIDCANNNVDDHLLGKIIAQIQDIGRLRIVITSRNPCSSVSFSGRPHTSAEVLGFSSNDKVELINFSGPRWLTRTQANTILSKYEVKFQEMPPLIWIAVGELFKKQAKQNRESSLSQIMKLIKDAQIYEKFIELSFSTVTDENLGSPISIDLYQLALMIRVLEKVLPSTSTTILNRAIVYCPELCTGICDLRISNLDFEDYLIDLFSIHALKRCIEFDSVRLPKLFTEFFINRYYHKSENFKGRHLNDMLGYMNSSQQFPFEISEFDVTGTISLLGQCPNICRKIFESFLLSPNIQNLIQNCSPNINVANIFRFLHFHKPGMTATQILLLCSAHFGFSKLFECLLDTKMADISMQNIQIRHRHSFRSVLHLLMYCSRDDDCTTIMEKKTILNYVFRVKPKLLFTRDYYGNTPILEQNVNFELVRVFLKHGANLEDTDYQRRNILDKNSNNLEFSKQLELASPAVYYRLNLSSFTKSYPVKFRCLENTCKSERKISNDDVERYFLKKERKARNYNRFRSLTPKEAGLLLFEHCEDNVTNNDLAWYVLEALHSNEESDEFQTTFLTTILATENLQFKHQELCSLINSSIEDLTSKHFTILDQLHKVMCQKESPFIVASLHGLTNIAVLLSKSFSVYWLDLLNDFELGCLFLAWDKHNLADVTNEIISKLQAIKYKIPYEVVKMALNFGSLRLFKIFVEKLEFTPDRWRKLEDSKAFMALHHVLENSMHDSEEVFMQKKMLIDYITDFFPKSVKSCDKRGRTALLLNRTHNRLIRHLISKPGVNINAVDAKGNNVLNVYLCNIIRLSEYLGESDYDKNFSHHDQVVYLAKKVGVNDLANRQIGWILLGMRTLTKIKTKALRAAGFKPVNEERCSLDMYKKFDQGLDRHLIFNGNESEDELVAPSDD